MRLTIRSNLAMRTLMFCAVNPDRIVRKHEIALVCNASENHLAQVVNALAQHGYIATQRGRSGGLKLAHRAQDIRIGAVLRSFEAGLPFAECFDPDTNTCPLAGACVFRTALEAAVDAFYVSMDRWTLADLVADNGMLDQLLRMPANGKAPACSSRKAPQQAGLDPLETAAVA